jgi:hypothetical protein
MDDQTDIGQAAPQFLHQALDRAEADIAAGRAGRFPAPRPYPDLVPAVIEIDCMPLGRTKQFFFEKKPKNFRSYCKPCWPKR